MKDAAFDSSTWPNFKLPFCVFHGYIVCLNDGASSDDWFRHLWFVYVIVLLQKMKEKKLTVLVQIQS
jgi:predicted transcriptional regulator